MSYRRLVWTVVLVCVSSLAVRVTRAENSLRVGVGVAGRDQIAEAPLFLSVDRTAHGYIMAFEWDADLGRGEELVPRDGPGDLLEEADTIVFRAETSFMILGVSMQNDLLGCETIPPGQNQEVGIAKIRCLGGGDQRQETPIRLVDGKYALVDGNRPLDNLVLFDARFLTSAEGSLTLRDGTLVCTERVQPGTTAFGCGGPLGADGRPLDAAAAVAETVQVNYYYSAPGEGLGDQRDQIQGLSMAVRHGCDVLPVDGSFSVTGTVLEEIGAEFVNIDFDVSTADDDGCEFIVGVLVDAEAPFDGRTLPATEQFRRLFSIEFEVQPGAVAGTCVPVEFVDGLFGNGQVPVNNLVSIDFTSRTPDLASCRVCVREPGVGDDVEFARGDCNFSTTSGTPVDIADAAAAVGFIFLTGAQRFAAPCEDACDANDDGRLDAADIVFVLEYLFVPASPVPPAPGPLAPGIDPTPDELTCRGRL